MRCSIITTGDCPMILDTVCVMAEPGWLWVLTAVICVSATLLLAICLVGVVYDWGKRVGAFDSIKRKYRAWREPRPITPSETGVSWEPDDEG